MPTPFNGRSMDLKVKSKLLNEELWDDYGTRLMYKDSSSLYVTIGARLVKQSVVRINDIATISANNLITGNSFSVTTWYFVYLNASGSFYIDILPPTKNENNQTISSNNDQDRYHPTQDYRYIGSFKTNSSSQILSFYLMGDLVLFKNSLNYLLIDYKSTSSKELVNIRSYMPVTSSIGYVNYYSNDTDETKSIGNSTTWLANFGKWGGSEFIQIENDSIYLFTNYRKVTIGISGYIEKI